MFFPELKVLKLVFPFKLRRFSPKLIKEERKNLFIFREIVRKVQSGYKKE